MTILAQFDYTDADFNHLAALIHQRVGISLHPNKKKLVYNRLVGRLRQHCFESFAQYVRLLGDQHDSEWEHFINALTTNLTYFYREHYHFELLKQHVQQNLLARTRSQPLTIWCAACSTGEEAYSIAMTLAEAFQTSQPPVKILATDLNTSVLSQAKQGRYSLDQLERVTQEQLKRFFTYEKHTQVYEIKPEIKALVHFKRLNLVEGSWPMKKHFQIIFCRNVMIYFDKETQQRLLQRFADYLPKGALLFLGHSENLASNMECFKLLKQTTYRRV
ncbi:CheR family methyltransferase [Vibrio sp. WXL103]|uniref:CheR family methyltransferase n=1 Tax=Vibrio sp. WXL103 TaxID=3450710 RepID=UPI003EC54E35